MSRSTSVTTNPLPSNPLPTTSVLSARLPRRAALAAFLLPLAACGPDAADDSGAPEPEGGSPTDGGAAVGALSVSDPWVKAAEDGMTSAFGTLTNDTGQDFVLSGARTPASTRVELHETASDGSGGMSMQEKEGGFELPAGQELVLEPGGNHLMLMELTAALLPGDEVELILEFEDGTEHPFTATVKDFAGAQEHYVPQEDAGSGASDDGGAHGGGDHGGEHAEPEQSSEDGHGEHGDDR